MYLVGHGCSEHLYGWYSTPNPRWYRDGAGNEYKDDTGRF